MEFQVHWVDVAKPVEEGKIPEVLYKRPTTPGGENRGEMFNVAEVARRGTFWVPVFNLLNGKEQWAKTTTGELVRIPLFPYETTAPYEAALFGTGIQLGMLAVAGFRVQAEKVKDCKVVMALSNQAYSLADNRYNVFAGFAFCLF